MPQPSTPNPPKLVPSSPTPTLPTTQTTVTKVQQRTRRRSGIATLDRRTLSKAQKLQQVEEELICYTIEEAKTQRKEESLLNAQKAPAKCSQDRTDLSGETSATFGQSLDKEDS